MTGEHDLTADTAASTPQAPEAAGAPEAPPVPATRQPTVTEPAPEPRPAAPPPAPTLQNAAGHPGVDAVLASLAELDTLPVAEHVAVFERAHATLSAALAEAGRGDA